MNQTASAGRSGKEVRSDCEITLTLGEAGGISIELQSKVASLYGASIRELIARGLAFFNIGNAAVKIDDSGALPYTDRGQA